MKEQRWERILSMLEKDSYVSVQKLSRTLYVSPPTVRRDLTELEKRGLIIRNHGGAKLPSDGHSEIPVGFRNSFKVNEKRRLCESAAALVHDGDVIYIDPSTTFCHLSDYISERKGIIAVTSSISTAVSLVEAGIRTFCTGGELGNVSMSFVGSRAEDFVRDFNFDIAFFSAYGINGRGMIVDTNEFEITLRRAAMKNSKKNVFVCSGEKFSLDTPFNLAPLSEMDVIITDATVPEYCDVKKEKIIYALPMPSDVSSDGSSDGGENN